MLHIRGAATAKASTHTIDSLDWGIGGPLPDEDLCLLNILTAVNRNCNYCGRLCSSFFYLGYFNYTIMVNITPLNLLSTEIGVSHEIVAFAIWRMLSPGRLVAPITNTCLRPSKPSSIVKSWSKTLALLPLYMNNICFIEQTSFLHQAVNDDHKHLSVYRN